jgi:hypothetical protein
MGKLKGMGFLQPFDRKNAPDEWSNKLRYAFMKAYQGFDVIPPILEQIDGWHYNLLVLDNFVLKLELKEFSLHLDNSIIRGAGNLFKPVVSYMSWHMCMLLLASFIFFF